MNHENRGVKLESDENRRNSEIFRYLRNKKIIPTYETIDEDMGYENQKYSNKFSSQNNTVYIKKIHTLAFEAKYKIPHTLFFNDDIEYEDDIKRFIDDYRATKGTLVENMSPESLDAFKKFVFLYIYDKTEGLIVKRKISITDQYISIWNLDTEKLNFSGYVNISCSSIILLTQNTVTRNSVIFKVLLRALVLKILPVSYLGHRTSSNEEVSGYGICSETELADEDIKMCLTTKTTIFSEMEKEIISNIKKLNK